MEIAADEISLPDRAAPEHEAVRAALLGWYARQGRDLPWRRTNDPYHVLVSEFMLQQTQVDRVIPKYHAFLERYPTVKALADAPTADVIRAWSGSGLQPAGRQPPVGGAAGRWPSTAASSPTTRLHWSGLNGIGALHRRRGRLLRLSARRRLPRTRISAAFCTVSTTVRRCRRRRASERELWALADAALPIGRGYDWGQALMDLGAMVCTATRPLCPACPLVDLCRAAPAFLRYGLPERAHARPARAGGDLQGRACPSSRPPATSVAASSTRCAPCRPARSLSLAGARSAFPRRLHRRARRLAAGTGRRPRASRSGRACWPRG